MSARATKRRRGWRKRLTRRLADLLPECIAELESKRLLTLATELAEQGDALDDPSLADRLIDVGCRWAPPEDITGIETRSADDTSGADHGPPEQSSDTDDTPPAKAPRNRDKNRRAAQAVDNSARLAYDRLATATLALRLAATLAARQPHTSRVFASSIASQKLTLHLARAATTDRLRANALAALRQVIESAPLEERQRILSPEVAEHLQHWCRPQSRSRFRAIEAFGLLVDSFPHLALRRAHEELEAIDAPEGDFVRRSFFLRHLRRHEAGLGLWIAHVHRCDPSEMVRQTLADLLLQHILEQAEPEGELWLHFAHALGPDTEASERVRAFASRAACRALVAHPRRQLGELVGTCLKDPAPLVRQVCCEHLRVGALHLAQRAATPEHQRIAGRLLRTIIARRNDASVPANEAAALADVSEALRLLDNPEALSLYQTLSGALASTQVGHRCMVSTGSEDQHEAPERILALLSQDDVDLFAERRSSAYLVRRGARRPLRLWRALHELSHPRAEKRSDVAHTRAAKASETIRAPARLLGSASASYLIGERRIVPSEGSWGRHLPLPSDLLDLGIVRGKEAVVYSSRGITWLRAPSSLIARLRLHWAVSRQLSHLTELRERSLAASGERRSAYMQRLRDLGAELSFETYPLDLEGKPWPVHDPWATSCFGPTNAGGSSTTLTAAFSVPLLPGLFDRLAETFPELLAYLTEPTANDVSQLVHFLALGMVGVIAGSRVAQWRADRALQKIPLTLGGWGTRGKSSLERLKAAMFAGFGYEVLCKTTGSTPALLYMPPWEEPTEIPIYRPGGRATIWEQRDVLAIAARLGVQVFTWECMAIRPGYAQILASHWSKDRYTTLTNTYPDHESQQGPGAEEVTRSLLRVSQPGSTVLTAEQSMLPVLVAQAQARDVRIVSVPAHDDELIAADLMRLFPYLEHRKNVALLRRLAEQLGFDADQATVEAATRARPDIGALSQIGPINVGAHQISLVNAMAANDPVSTLESQKHIDRDGPARVVVIANTRRDRPDRTELFAKVLAAELPATGRIVTGTDTRVFMRCYRRALRGEAAIFAASSGEEAQVLVDRVLRQIGLQHADGAAVLSAVLGAALLQQPFTTDGARRDLLAANEKTLANLRADSLAEARRLCQSSKTWTELDAMFAGSPSPVAKRCKAAWLSASSKAVVAASLSRRARESQPDAEWLGHLRRFFVEAMEQSTVAVAPHVDSIVRDALHLAPAGPLLLLAIQNIGGVGMQLLQSFVGAAALLDRETLPVADPSDMHVARRRQTPGRNDLLAAAATLQAAKRCGSSHPSKLTDYRAALHAHLSAQDSRLSAFGRWLTQSWDVTRALLLAPVRRVRAAIVLHRFATRRICAAQAREQLLTIDGQR